MRLPQLLLLALLATLATGCVAGRRTVALPIPSAASYPAKKGSLYIATVADQRTFQDKPSDPSTPSVDGSVAALTPGQKSMMIGRQRNTYGLAMGDIALPAGSSVPEVARELLAEGFKRRGYDVAGRSGNAVHVSVDEFWAWFTPGMWSISFEAKINCVLTIRQGGQSSRLVVRGYGYNGGQIASDTNWRQAYERAFEDFLGKLDGELARAGF